MSERRAKHLVLILSRELASNLATPTALADDEGRVVFFNEAAERLVGERFVDTDEPAFADWTARFSPRTFGDEPLPAEERPAAIALGEHRPAHVRYLATTLDGVGVAVSVTAVPLFAHADEFVGAIVFFWRDGDDESLGAIAPTT